jgi:hypothetical protein
MHNDDDGNRDADDDQTVVSGSDNRVVLRETTKGLAIARPMSMSHRSAFAPTIVDRHRLISNGKGPGPTGAPLKTVLPAALISAAKKCW